MKFIHAKKLHNEDEVIVKETGRVLTVINIEIDGNDVFVRCSDGNLYHHRALK